MAALGRAEEGLPSLHRGLAVTRAIGQRQHLPQTLTMLAFAYGKAGQPEQGCAGWQKRRKSPTRHKIAGRKLSCAACAEICCWRRAERLRPKTAFAAALSVARQQNGRLWELRVAVSLARLWHGGGRNEEARTLLQPIYGWFTEGVDMPDLREARILLDELA